MDYVLLLFGQLLMTPLGPLALLVGMVLWKDGRSALSFVAIILGLGCAGCSAYMYAMTIGDHSAGAGLRGLGSLWFAGMALAYWVVAVVGYILVARAKRRISEGTEEALRDVGGR